MLLGVFYYLEEIMNSDHVRIPIIRRGRELGCDDWIVFCKCYWTIYILLISGMIVYAHYSPIFGVIALVSSAIFFWVPVVLSEYVYYVIPYKVLPENRFKQLLEFLLKNDKWLDSYHPFTMFETVEHHNYIEVNLSDDCLFYLAIEPINSGEGDSFLVFDFTVYANNERYYLSSDRKLQIREVLLKRGLYSSSYAFFMENLEAKTKFEN
jgi:hypothetical protein